MAIMARTCADGWSVLFLDENLWLNEGLFRISVFLSLVSRRRNYWKKESGIFISSDCVRQAETGDMVIWSCVLCARWVNTEHGFRAKVWMILDDGLWKVWMRLDDGLWKVWTRLNESVMKVDSIVSTIFKITELKKIEKFLEYNFWKFSIFFKSILKVCF